MLASFNVSQLEDPKTPVYLCTWDEGIVEVHTKQSLIEDYLNNSNLGDNNNWSHNSSYGEWDYESFRDYLDKNWFVSSQHNTGDFTRYTNDNMTIERIN